MINVGVIGLGATWSQHYQSAIDSLKSRIALRAVYDPVFSKAKTVASNRQNCTAMTGMLALARRPDINALLILDSSWYEHHALELVCQQQQPIFVCSDSGYHSAEGLQRLHRQAVDVGQNIVPELTTRYTPASVRLQELMATQLGRPHLIRINQAMPAHVDLAQAEHDFSFLCDLFDWCCYIARASAGQIRTQVSSQSGHGARLQHVLTVMVDLDTTRADHRVPKIQIELVEDHSEATGGKRLPAIKEIHCEHGQATIGGDRSISWEVDNNCVDETLTAERTSAEVMLDLFCRRVAGGLVPIGSLADIWRGLAMAKAASQSIKAGRGIAIETLDA